MKLNVLIVAKSSKLRNALQDDLSAFTPTVQLVQCPDLSEAKATIKDIVANGDEPALLIGDDVLTSPEGRDLLTALSRHEDTEALRKILVSGKKDLKAVIHAVNETDIERFIIKPWDLGELHHVVKDQLTDYVVQRDINPLRYLQALNQVRALDGTRELSDTD